MEYKKCWNCGSQNHENAEFCTVCNKILPILETNYFSLFEISEAFDLDYRQLDAFLFNKLKKFHPDRFANSSITEKQISRENTSLFNKVYSVLKEPMKRAAYLLKSKGCDSDDSTRKMPQSMLLEAMEWREKLEESLSECEELFDEIIKLESQKMSTMNECFQNNNYNKALDVFFELKFIIRFKNELNSKIEEYDNIV